jgi:hypothetical protein
MRKHQTPNLKPTQHLKPPPPVDVSKENVSDLYKAAETAYQQK